MENRRNLPRYPTVKSGSIVFARVTGDPVTEIDCRVSDISGTGACLAVTAAADIPDAFTLIIKPEMLRRTCEVVRRSENEIGVQFV